MKISVIICSYNPKVEYLRRAIFCIQKQDFAMEELELLLIDNGSDIKLESEVDLSWNTNNRIIREENIGLTNARLCGIKNANGEIMIFVDDDNLLKSDYLSQSYNIYKKFSFLGAWGGKISGEFETTPPIWFEPKHYEMLAIRDVKRDVWSNLLFNWETTPIGAGLVVTHNVAQLYFDSMQKEENKKFIFDRKGKNLISGGDNQIVLTAISSGYGCGRFKSLELTHLIPENRLTLDYMVNLTKSMALSNVLLFASYNLKYEPFPKIKGFLSRIIHKKKLIKMPRIKRMLLHAEQDGIKVGYELLKTLKPE